jgi:hypothetical protein
MNTERLEAFKKVVNQYTAFKTEFDSLVREAAMDYATHEKLAYPTLDYPSDKKYIQDWELDNEGDIIVNWYETWSYGGQADGNFHFPSLYLTDTEAFNHFKTNCIKAREDKNNREKKDKLNAAKREFERLKKELEQAE